MIATATLMVIRVILLVCAGVVAIRNVSVALIHALGDNVDVETINHARLACIMMKLHMRVGKK